MPATRDEIEFHLLEVTVDNDGESSKAAEVLKPMMRTGDTLFEFEGKNYMAVVGTRLGGMRAARRLTALALGQGLSLTIAMVEEPFSFPFQRALDRVVGGWIKVFPRREEDRWHG